MSADDWHRWATAGTSNKLKQRTYAAGRAKYGEAFFNDASYETFKEPSGLFEINMKLYISRTRTDVRDWKTLFADPAAMSFNMPSPTWQRFWPRDHFGQFIQALSYAPPPDSGTNDGYGNPLPPNETEDHRKMRLTGYMEFVKDTNTARARDVINGSETTGDETINPMTHRDCPYKVFLDRKPYDGPELKNRCCADSGVMLHQELQLGVEEMADAKYTDEYIKTCAGALRMMEAEFHTNRLYLLDAVRPA